MLRHKAIQLAFIELKIVIWSAIITESIFCELIVLHVNTRLFKMIFVVLETCNTKYT